MKRIFYAPPIQQSLLLSLCSWKPSCLCNEFSLIMFCQRWIYFNHIISASWIEKETSFRDRGLGWAYERCHYNVTASFIGRAHTQNDPCLWCDSSRNPIVTLYISYVYMGCCVCQSNIFVWKQRWVSVWAETVWRGSSIVKQLPTFLNNIISSKLLILTN